MFLIVFEHCVFILYIGSGNHAVLNQDCFKRRIEAVKRQGHHGLAVLHGLQCNVVKLSHPPSCAFFLNFITC